MIARRAIGMFLLSATAIAAAEESLSRNLVGGEGESLIETLRGIDELYARSMTASGSEHVGKEAMRPGDPGGVFQWRWTRNQDELVVHSIREDRPAPIFIPRGTSRFADYDDDGNFLALFLEEELHHFSPEERFRLQRYRRIAVSPQGVAVREEVFDSVAFFAAADDEPAFPVKRAIWSGGRGFGDHLEEVLESRVREDGQWEALARGFDSRGGHGQWRLVIDPARSWLVTSAAYTRDGRDTPTIRIENSGLLRNGTCEVPEAARWTVDLGYVIERSAVHQAAGFHVDEDLLAMGRAAKRGPFPDDAMTLDKRSGEYVGLERERKKHVVADSVQTSSRGVQFLWIFTGHLVVGGLALWIYRLSRAGRPGTRGSGEAA